MTARPPFPPFDVHTASQKVEGAEDTWNTCDPERVALAYTEDSVWRNRDQFAAGRAEIVEFLHQKWKRARAYARRKELWAFRENRIAVGFQHGCPRPRRVGVAVMGAPVRSAGDETAGPDQRPLVVTVEGRTVQTPSNNTSSTRHCWTCLPKRTRSNLSRRMHVGDGD
jgi:nuclear transport factor 2 (NTF2) superfamily protein